MVTWRHDIVADFCSNNLALLTINSILGLVLLITFYVRQTYYEKNLSSLSVTQFMPGWNVVIFWFNPLQPGVAFPYPRKTSENLKVFRCFLGV